MNKPLPHISIAPMLDWTDRHFRYMARLISPHTILYTEMITTGALLHGDRERFLRFDPTEHPVALQLGGSDPDDLATCAQMGQDAGYDEINLNCGCPSDRVQNGRFGACLMKEPDHVAACVESMIKTVNIPVTVKCRIGVDDQDEQEALDDFVQKIAAAGCKTVIIHARKAWLKGLSPKENRDIPPLNYDRVYAVKDKFPDHEIINNGGIRTLTDIKTHLEKLDGVMIGREAYQNPYIFAEIERSIFDNHTIKSRQDIARDMIPYIEQQNKTYNTPIKSITRHMMGLFHSQPGGRKWRQALSTLPYKDGATAQSVIDGALAAKNNL